MKDLELVRRFTTELGSLRARRCWAVFYGAATGAVIQVHFEPKRARVEPLRNPHLSDDERKFDGEFALYISCAWRLDDKENVLLTSGDAVSDPNRLAAALEQLVGRQVTGVDTTPPGWDVMLTFDGGFRLRVFCDQPDGRDNYNLSTPAEIFAVTVGDGIVVEPR